MNASESVSILDRAHLLLLSLINAGIQVQPGPDGLDALGRDCVRCCRAMENEAETPTERRPAARPKSQRPAPPQPEETGGEEEGPWDQ